MHGCFTPPSHRHTVVPLASVATRRLALVEASVSCPQPVDAVVCATRSVKARTSVAVRGSPRGNVKLSIWQVSAYVKHVGHRRGVGLIFRKRRRYSVLSKTHGKGGSGRGARYHVVSACKARVGTAPKRSREPE